MRLRLPPRPVLLASPLPPPLSLRPRSQDDSLPKATGRPPVFFQPYRADKHVMRVIKHAHQRTSDPAWILVNRLARPNRRLALVTALAHAGESAREFEAHWRRAVEARDFNGALVALERRRSALAAPPWLVLHLLAHTVRTPMEAVQATKFALAHAPRVPRYAAWMLVLATHAVARTGAIPALSRLTTAFAALPAELVRAHHANALLAALAQAPRSETSAHCVLAVLDTMAARGLHVHREMLRALLADDFVTQALVGRLRTRLSGDGLALDVRVLEAALRAFARYGATAEARQVLERLRAELGPQGPHVADQTPTTRGRFTRWHSTYLSAFRSDSSTAIRYLAALVPAQAASRAARLAQDISAVRRAAAHQRRFTLGAHKAKILRGATKPGADIHDWTAVIGAAAADVKNVNASQLFSLFKRTPMHLAVGVVTLTAVIRGLFIRRDIPRALRLWKGLRRTGLHLDARALAVGAQLLAAARQLGEALALFEAHSRRVDTVAVNALCSGLLMGKRGDIVLLLWDCMDRLYGVRPDARTLGLLLRAAADVTRAAQDSVAGAWAQWRQTLPFAPDLPRDAWVPGEPRRAAIAALAAACAGEPSPHVHWRGLPAGAAAAHVFEQAVLGNAPELLRAVAPARALRQSADDVALRPFAELRALLGARTDDGLGAILGADTVTAEGAAALPGLRELAAAGLHPPPYPELAADDGSFRAYMLLLCATGRARGLARALAWMRALDVRPERRTLALVLPHWAEVAQGPVWLDARRGGGEYERLTAWLEAWVGSEGMPAEEDMADALRWIATKRGRGMSKAH